MLIKFTTVVARYEYLLIVHSKHQQPCGKLDVKYSAFDQKMRQMLNISPELDAIFVKDIQIMLDRYNKASY